MESPRAAGALLRIIPRTASSHIPYIRSQQQRLPRSFQPMLYARSFSGTAFVHSEPAAAKKPSRESKAETPSTPNSDPKNASSPSSPTATTTTTTTPTQSASERFQFISNKIFEKPAQRPSSSLYGQSIPGMRNKHFDGIIGGSGGSKPAGGKPDNILDALWDSQAQAFSAAPLRPEYTGPMPDLSPSTGKSIVVDPAAGVDLGQGLRKLDRILTVNRVRMDVQSQRFHERPGLKRKRLKSQRWRRRFREGFQYLTARVNKLRQQGW